VVVDFNWRKHIVFLCCMLFFGCKTQNKTFYTPTIICELKSSENKIILTSQVKFSGDKKSEKNNVINLMYDELLFKGLRQNNCILNRIIIDPNPRIKFKSFLENFWNDDSREGKYHRILIKKKNQNSTSTYTVEFDIIKLNNYLNENNIK